MIVISAFSCGFLTSTALTATRITLKNTRMTRRKDISISKSVFGFA